MTTVPHIVTSNAALVVRRNVHLEQNVFYHHALVVKVYYLLFLKFIVLSRFYLSKWSMSRSKFGPQTKESAAH